jgi:hypothetical protein
MLKSSDELLSDDMVAKTKWRRIKMVFHFFFILCTCSGLNRQAIINTRGTSMTCACRNMYKIYIIFLGAYDYRCPYFTSLIMGKKALLALFLFNFTRVASESHLQTKQVTTTL